MAKIYFKFDRQTLARMDNLKSKAGVSTRKGVVEKALQLLETVIAAQETGEPVVINPPENTPWRNHD